MSSVLLYGYIFNTPSHLQNEKRSRSRNLHQKYFPSLNGFLFLSHAVKINRPYHSLVFVPFFHRLFQMYEHDTSLHEQ